MRQIGLADTLDIAKALLEATKFASTTLVEMRAKCARSFARHDGERDAIGALFGRKACDRHAQRVDVVGECAKATRRDSCAANAFVERLNRLKMLKSAAERRVNAHPASLERQIALIVCN